jgi:glycosyltransferase involved in cell wall biosynthesis
MSASLPLVSVIVPVYNGSQHLRDAVQSIERQGYEPCEIIVVDDGSTDDTPGVIASLGGRVRALRQDNAGPGAARNYGIAASHGELVAFCDADDTWPDDKLHRQVGRLQEDRELDVVLGRVQYVADEGEQVPNVQFEDPYAQTLTHVHLGSGIYTRRSFEKVGLFDETLRFSEDVDWFFRARELGVKIRIMREITLRYRIHAGNMTRGVAPSDLELITVLKRSVERRKAAGQEGISLGRWRDLDESADGIAPATGEPTVTVIIPVLDDTRYLEEAVDSALVQTHRPYEIIVVDDGSEVPVQLATRFQGYVTLTRVAHRGQGAARNLAAGRARGVLLAFLDADDVWLPDKLEQQVQLLQEDQELDMVFGRLEEFVSAELQNDAAPLRERIRERTGPMPSTFLVRTKAFRRVGGFREDVVFGEFIDWYSRATEAGLREATIDRVVTRRRIHDRNAGVVRRELRGQYAQVLKDALDRRRSSPPW